MCNAVVMCSSRRLQANARWLCALARIAARIYKTELLSRLLPNAGVYGTDQTHWMPDRVRHDVIHRMCGTRYSSLNRGPRKKTPSNAGRFAKKPRGQPHFRRSTRDGARSVDGADQKPDAAITHKRGVAPYARLYSRSGNACRDQGFTNRTRPSVAQGLIARV